MHCINAKMAVLACEKVDVDVLELGSEARRKVLRQGGEMLDLENVEGVCTRGGESGEFVVELTADEEEISD